MIDFQSSNVWIAPGSTDMRKSIDGLAATVQHVIGQVPTSQQLFVFCSRNRNKIKILCWGGNGFWLLYKRLDRPTFKWPTDQKVPVCVSRRQLTWLLEGLSIDQRQAHRAMDIRFTS